MIWKGQLDNFGTKVTTCMPMVAISVKIELKEFSIFSIDCL